MKNEVKKIRKKRGMRQKELSLASSVPHSTLSDIERGRCVPKIDTALKLAKALRCSVDDLFELEDGIDD